MIAFTVVMFCIQIVRVVVRLHYLCTDCYPRVEHRRAWEDVLSMIVAIGFVVWAAILIYTL